MAEQMPFLHNVISPIVLQNLPVTKITKKFAKCKAESTLILISLLQTKEQVRFLKNLVTEYFTFGTKK